MFFYFVVIYINFVIKFKAAKIQAVLQSCHVLIDNRKKNLKTNKYQSHNSA